MVINEFKLGNTTVKIDNSYITTDEDERRQRCELFNEVGCEIYSNINI